MKNNRSRIKISELCEKIIDCVNKTAPHVDYQTPYKMIRTPNIKKGEINLKDCRCVTKEVYEKWTRRSTVDKGDVLFTREAPLGEVGYVNFQDNVFLGQRVMQYRANPNKIDSLYLFYSFLSPDLQQQFRRHDNSGSIVSHIRVPDCSEFEVNVPSLNEQRKISKILHALDQKRRTNNSISFELESMAKTLYDYRFVQFEFPDENGKPYKSSGGEMVWSDDLKKEIPKEWDVKNLNNIFEFEKGSEPGASEYLDAPINKDCIKFFRVGDIDGDSCIYVDTNNKKYVIVSESDVIVTFDGSVGKLGFGLDGAISGGLRKIYDKSKKYDNSLAYFIFRDERIIATIHKYATGSILLHASGAIEHLKIPFQENIYLKFQSIVKPIFSKMVMNKKENQELYVLRDWLLPMLMNGQVVVG